MEAFVEFISEDMYSHFILGTILNSLHLNLLMDIIAQVSRSS